MKYPPKGEKDVQDIQDIELEVVSSTESTALSDHQLSGYGTIEQAAPISLLSSPSATHIQILRGWLFREAWFSEFLEKIILLRNKRDPSQNFHHLRRLHVITTALGDKVLPAWQIVTLVILLSDGISYVSLPSQRYDLASSELLSGRFRRHWSWGGPCFDGFANQAGFWVLPLNLILLPSAALIIEGILQYRLMKSLGSVSSDLERPLPTSGSSGFSRFLETMPYSHYRRALSLAEFLLRRDSHSEAVDLSQPREWLNSIIECAQKAPLFSAWPALAALAKIAGSVKNATSAPSQPLRINGDNDKLPDAASALLQRHFDIALSQDALEALKNIAADQNSAVWWRRELAIYYGWTLADNQDISNRRKAVYSLSTLLRLTTFFYSLYYYFEIIYARTTEAAYFFGNKKKCDKQEKIWKYSSVTGEYECTWCGDWEFVPPQKINNSQFCLNSLLAKERHWDTVFSGFARLEKSELTAIDFSNYNWVNWDISTTQNVFAALAPISQRWKSVNFSSSTPVPLWPNDGKLRELGHFLNAHPTNIFDLSGQSISGREWHDFLQIWHLNDRITELYLQNNNLGDAGMYALAGWLQQFSIEELDVLDLSYCQITRDGLAVLLAGLDGHPKLTLKLRGNLLGSASINLVTDWISTHAIKEIDLSENDFSGANFTSFAEAIGLNSYLTTVSLAGTQFSNIQLLELAEGWSNSTKTQSLINLDISGNRLFGEAIAQFGVQTRHISLQRVNWANNAIDDIGFTAITSELPNTRWTDVDFSGNPFTSESLASLWPALPGTQIKFLRLAHLSLSPLPNQSLFSPLISLLKNRLLWLAKLDLTDTQMDQPTARELIEIACEGTIDAIYLDQNGLTDEIFNTKSPIEACFSRTVDLSLNQIQGETVHALKFFKALPQSRTCHIDVSQNLLTDTFARTIASTLLDPNVDATLLATSIGDRDADRALHAAKSAMPLESFNLQGNAFTEEGEAALCRIAPYLSQLDLDAGNSDADWDLVNCQTSSASRLTSPFFGWSPQASLSNSARFNPPTSISVGLLWSMVPGLNTLLLLVVLYRMVKPFVTAGVEMAEKTFTRFNSQTG